MSNFVISLDFELFWGVADSRTIENYRDNVYGEWVAIPRLLDLFSKYGVRATWATVGMLMCENYSEWREIRPSSLPSYSRGNCSTYTLDSLTKEYPRLFFARPLVQQILDTPGQELASHTYSHFFCGEGGVTPTQFLADLECAQAIAGKFGITCRSLVFPRNQVRLDFIPPLRAAGIIAFRGNQRHWLYANGHVAPLGRAGRAIRFADSWLPLSGDHVGNCEYIDGLANIPTSIFLRPWTPRFAGFEGFRLARLTRMMDSAAVTDGIFHIWWHPHNFGINIDANISFLEKLLIHFSRLRDRYGMKSSQMQEFEAPQSLSAH